VGRSSKEQSFRVRINSLTESHDDRSENMSEEKDEVLKAAEAIGVGKIRRHIFLCADQTEPKCSRKEDSLVSWNYLKRRLKELGVSENGVARTKANCLRICRDGPTAVVRGR